MTNYRRMRVEGGTYFFTVALANRRASTLVDHIDFLREACRMVFQTRPVDIDAMVVLPDHLHAVWTLPEGDARDLVERGGRGYACDPVDPDAIADALVRLHADWVRGATAATEPPAYERGALTARLAAFLDRVGALPPRDA